MAIVLEFNLICKAPLDLSHMLYNSIICKGQVEIERLSCTDNWLWMNQQTIENIFSLNEKLEEDKIVIINLKAKAFKDLGIYAEKVNDEFVYELWINLEGYSALDEEEVNDKNESYYQKMYQVIEEVINEQKLEFRILGIGLETKFEYAKYNYDVIKRSENIIVWIVNKDSEEDIMPAGCNSKRPFNTDLLIYEKRKM